jgi:hypothetical protein
MILSSKHHSKHERGKSSYPKRLSARGLSRAPKMPDLDTLRARRNAESFPVALDEHLRHVAAVQTRQPLYYGRRPYDISAP